ncbi:MAG: 2'-5' RNA ligase family protein [Clostridia bacterium]|nr:2'-5' RNA ligase family protein [Clostridia bacterium]
MHLWTAVDLTGKLDGIRKKALWENQQIGLTEVAFTLPAHVSLKISFSLPDEICPQAIGEAAEIFRACPAFEIGVKGLDRTPSILWIAMEENDPLRALHERMVALAEKYGAAPHPFDRQFFYHSTLFLSDDQERLSRMEEALRDIPLPEKITADAFLIGGSETGKPGEYRVFHRIPALPNLK